MFSFLVAYDTRAWESRTYEFSRERFCQAAYTEAAIRDRIASLSAPVIVELQAMPALFAYEGTVHPVKVGRLLRVEERGDRIFIEFDFDYSIPPIPFASIEPLRVALDLRNVYELNTTHWSIKNVDLYRTLSGAGLLPTGPAAPAQAGTTTGAHTGRSAVEGDVELLCAALRRLGSGAARTLVNRRHNRPGITVIDEYDVQDLMEVLLRSLYGDVRREEPTASSAGSYSRMDWEVRSHELAVEAKVTARGRAEREIKGEILRDIHDYQGHRYVKTLVVVVYDLALTFSNINGFEHDLSGRNNDVDVIVLVVPWTGPR